MKLPCLSIQQPLVEDIFQGFKPVENRGWRWLVARDWNIEGPVMLGIHASSNRSGWRELSDQERDECWPGWRTNSGPPFGCVVGIVDLLRICRPENLPHALRDHECVNSHPDNWCWVLANPRRFPRMILAKGQARLFYVEVLEVDIEQASHAPYIGVQGDPDANEYKIRKVLSGSPAEKAGLEVDDIVTKCDGRQVDGFVDFVERVWRKKPGDELHLEVVRGGQLIRLTVLIAKRPG